MAINDNQITVQSDSAKSWATVDHDASKISLASSTGNVSIGGGPMLGVDPNSIYGGFQQNTPYYPSSGSTYIYQNGFDTQIPASVYVDEDGRTIALLPDGHRIDISEWAKRDVLERTKEFLRKVLEDKSDEPEKLLQDLVGIKILFDMHKDEVDMASKYLELCERFIYDRTFLSDMDADVPEETLDGECGAEDALPPEV